MAIISRYANANGEDMICTMIRSGASAAYTSRCVGCSVSTVRRVMKRYGLRSLIGPGRPRGLYGKRPAQSCTSDTTHPCGPPSPPQPMPQHTSPVPPPPGATIAPLQRKPPMPPGYIGPCVSFVTKKAADSAKLSPRSTFGLSRGSTDLFCSPATQQLIHENAIVAAEARENLSRIQSKAPFFRTQRQ